MMLTFFTSLLQTIQRSTSHRVASWALTAAFVFSLLFCIFKNDFQEATTTLLSHLKPLMTKLDAPYLFICEVCLPACSFALAGIAALIVFSAVMDRTKSTTKVPPDKRAEINSVLNVNLGRLVVIGKILLAYALFDESLNRQTTSILTQPSSIKEVLLSPIYWLLIMYALYDVVVTYPIADTRRIQAEAEASRSN